MKNKPNILIMDAGGPCGISVIKLLKKNSLGTVVAADMDVHSPAFPLADIALVIPPANKEDFTEAISFILKKYNIDIVLPTFEHGFLPLSKLEDSRFVTDFDSALLCKDKLAFNKKCFELGLPVPHTRLLREVDKIDHPMYIKPRFGVGSVNNFSVTSNEVFQGIKEYLTKVSSDEFIVQDLLEGVHWNVDVLVKDGKYVTSVPRRDIRQKAGNCITVSIENKTDLIKFSKQVKERLNIKSPFNLEVFEKDGKFIINEINVRFGGGVIFSALAGIDLVSYTVTGDTKFVRDLNEGIYSRYYEEIKLDLNKVKNDLS